MSANCEDLRLYRIEVAGKIIVVWAASLAQALDAASQAIRGLYGAR